MELRPNRVKRKLAAGENAIVVSGLVHADAIDAFGPIGADGIWLEGEHGGVDAAELGNLTRACDIWGMTSVARINANDQGLIYRTLDRGAQGIVVPHVNNRSEVQNVIAGGKFPPVGKRGYFPSRQSYGVNDFYEQANNETLLVVLIEDIAAWENLDEIIEVDHIDVFFVAPGDFAASMGHTRDLYHPEVQEKVNDALSRIIDAGRTAGTLATSETIEGFSEMGVRFFYVEIQPWLEAGARDLMARAEAGHRRSR